MGVSRTEIFSEKQNRIARLAKAFAHPARVAILEHLFKIEGCVCGDLVEEIGLAQPTISQHFKELKNLDLIKGTVDGVRVCYCINTDEWSSMKEVINEFLNKDINGNTCC